METEGIFTEPVDMLGSLDLLHSLDRFFDRILYYAAVGYQNAADQVRLGDSRQPAPLDVRHPHCSIFVPSPAYK